ncbi:hypothetical protein HDF16_005676 [Granulicella aggregans]|uniref:Uncharacterized protein n=1 Tax=Granulicella aggregans TaxID=474949 RepID=A0A7W7ZJ97_9BACT|nr:hypothetical protein [Granulicella aggregans]MBB5060940.1 hypothetical protein [Granulicella aggregans]
MNPFDTVLDWFSDKFRHDAEHRLASFLPDGAGSLKANEHYFRLWLDEMFLSRDRDWFSSWHPAVHSAVTFEFGDQTQVITRIAGASSLKDVDTNHLDRVITLSTALTALMPFRGGTVRINAALLAMQGTNSVKLLVDVLGEISTKLAVPQLSMALDIAKPLAQGVSALVGVTNGEMMLGLDATLSGTDLQSGSYAILFATPQEIAAADLSLVDHHLLLRGKPLTGQNYMVLRIERVDSRDDFDSLSAIYEPYQLAIDLLSQGDLPAAQNALKQAVRAALKSNDLSESDRRRVIDALKKRYADARDLLGAAAVSEFVSDSLDELISKQAISVAEASALGSISRNEAFQDMG